MYTVPAVNENARLSLFSKNKLGLIEIACELLFIIEITVI